MDEATPLPKRPRPRPLGGVPTRRFPRRIPTDLDCDVWYPLPSKYNPAKLAPRTVALTNHQARAMLRGRC
jgi:hypothetical protein